MNEALIEKLKAARKHYKDHSWLNVTLSYADLDEAIAALSGLLAEIHRLDCKMVNFDRMSELAAERLVGLQKLQDRDITLEEDAALREEARFEELLKDAIENAYTAGMSFDSDEPFAGTTDESKAEALRIHYRAKRLAPQQAVKATPPDEEVRMPAAAMAALEEAGKLSRTILPDAEVPKDVQEFLNRKCFEWHGGRYFREDDAIEFFAGKALLPSTITADQLPDWYGMSTPYPLHNVLHILAHAADQLLNRYNYDGHGHERIIYARNRAREVVALLGVKPSPILDSEDKPVKPLPSINVIATVLCPDPHDERQGVYFSNEDWRKLCALMPGTKLYTY